MLCASSGEALLMLLEPVLPSLQAHLEAGGLCSCSLYCWKLKILTVLSSEPEMTMWPSGLRAMLCTPCVCPVLVARHTPADLQLCRQKLYQHTANAALHVPPTCAQVPAAYSAIQASCKDQRLGGMASHVHHSLQYEKSQSARLCPGRAGAQRQQRERYSQAPPQGEDMSL